VKGGENIKGMKPGRDFSFHRRAYMLEVGKAEKPGKPLMKR
jgi:hypothetical protein